MFLPLFYICWMHFNFFNTCLFFIIYKGVFKNFLMKFSTFTFVSEKPRIQDLADTNFLRDKLLHVLIQLFWLVSFCYNTFIIKSNKSLKNNLFHDWSKSISYSYPKFRFKTFSNNEHFILFDFLIFIQFDCKNQVRSFYLTGCCFPCIAFKIILYSFYHHKSFQVNKHC